MKIPVKIKLTRGMEAPTYATDGSAAVDLRAALDEGTTVTIKPGERALIPTGLAIAPESRDVVAILAPRSGLGCKKGIRLCGLHKHQCADQCAVERARSAVSRDWSGLF